MRVCALCHVMTRLVHEHAMRSLVVIVVLVLFFSAASDGAWQQASQAAGDSAERSAPRFVLPTNRATPIPPLPSEPVVFETAMHTIRVVKIADGLSRPWSLAFLPDGSILVTELTGQLRIVRDGVLDPRPIAGLPEVVARPYEGLQDIALHPKFAENNFVYFTYTKRGPGETAAFALARGRFEGLALSEVRDVFVASPWVSMGSGPMLGSRIAFDGDGYLYMATAAPSREWELAQDPGHHTGKVLRLRDDGTVPPDNPFVGQSGYKPEIYSLGHRSPLGLVVHPDTGRVLENENGPQGGDELNVILSGKNYGWPTASIGRDYSGAPYPTHESERMEPPLVSWTPSIAASGMAVYTGDQFPGWRGNIFVGSLAYAHLQRLTFNGQGVPAGRSWSEWLLVDLKQRIRDVREGPDGFLYLLTDAESGVLLRIEPAG